MNLTNENKKVQRFVVVIAHFFFMYIPRPWKFLCFLGIAGPLIRRLRIWKSELVQDQFPSPPNRDQFPPLLFAALIDQSCESFHASVRHKCTEVSSKGFPTHLVVRPCSKCHPSFHSGNVPKILLLSVSNISAAALKCQHQHGLPAVHQRAQLA